MCSITDECDTNKSLLNLSVFSSLQLISTCTHAIPHNETNGRRMYIVLFLSLGFDCVEIKLWNPVVLLTSTNDYKCI